MPLSFLYAAARTSPIEIVRRAARVAGWHASVRAAGNAFASVLAAADRFCRAYAARRLLREMRDWPDERLKDIGVTREELANAIRGAKQPFRWTPEFDPEARPISRARR